VVQRAGGEKERGGVSAVRQREVRELRERERRCRERERVLER